MKSFQRIRDISLWTASGYTGYRNTITCIGASANAGNDETGLVFFGYAKNQKFIPTISVEVDQLSIKKAWLM